MVRHGAGGRQGDGFFQTTLTGGTSTSRILTPQHRRKHTSPPPSKYTRSQRRWLCATGPVVVPITLIPLVDRLSQYNLHGHNQQADDGDIFGNVYPSSPAPNSSIFTFQNIGSQKQSTSHPTFQLNSGRSSRGKTTVSLFAEHCLTKAKLPHCDTFNVRIQAKAPRPFSYVLNNKHEASSSSWHSTGGTGFTLCSLFCSHKLNHGGNPTGLGRWSFAQFQGRGASTLCVYAAYCPVKNLRNPGSTWNQQCRFFSDIQDDPNPNPRAKFAEDLCQSISTRLTAGDSIILGVDHNDNIHSSALALKLKNWA